MNTTIEHDGDPLELFCGVPTLNGVVLSTKKTVTICAWCDEMKKITRGVMMFGYSVSHGICKDCAKNKMGMGGNQ